MLPLGGGSVWGQVLEDMAGSRSSSWAVSVPGCDAGMPREEAEANPVCSGREEGAGLGLCSAPEGTSSVGELRPKNCSPGQWWVPALGPHPH